MLWPKAANNVHSNEHGCVLSRTVRVRMTGIVNLFPDLGGDSFSPVANDWQKVNFGKEVGQYRQDDSNADNAAEAEGRAAQELHEQCAKRDAVNAEDILRIQRSELCAELLHFQQNIILDRVGRLYGFFGCAVFFHVKSVFFSQGCLCHYA